MATFSSCGYTFISPHSFLTHLTPGGFRTCLCVFNHGKNRRLVSLKLNLAPGLEFGEEKRRAPWWSCLCKKGWEEDADFALEAQILEFMKNSEKPEVFPSKKDLVDAGRMDLVEGIQKQGGWLAMGWDLDDDKDNEFHGNGDKDWDLMVNEREWDSEALQERVQSEVDCSSLAFSSSFSPASSGRPVEVAAMDDCGIEGILSRLERDRNMHFGFGFTEKGDSNAFSHGHDSDKESPVPASTDETVGGPSRRKPVSFNHNTGLGNNNGANYSQNLPVSGTDGLRNSTWRERSIQRAGFAHKEFEGDEILEIRNKSSELNGRKEANASEKEISDNEIQMRLQHLKLELSSVLQPLRSNVDELLSQKGDGNSIDNFHKLSDACEFQENEMINAKDKLRSIRARLAVLEGKMAMALIDAQRTVEEKQKRIDDAQRALQQLHTTYIVWPNSASEVLLAGSFDGWVTKRKMERSSTGVFSVCLKLYPGKYEIKFIVDGEWKIDPLRPTVNNNGFENNLLIIK